MAVRKKIVAAIDLSDISAAVVKSAIAQAKRHECSLVLVHVMEKLGGENERLLLPVLKSWVERAREETRALFDSFVGRYCTDAQVEIEAKILEGPVPELIIDEARKSRAKFLFLGAPHPERGLGATLGRVLRGARRPVLVVRRPPIAGYRNIVMGVDLENGNSTTAECSKSLAEETADWTLCNVINTGRFQHLLLGGAEAVDQRHEILNEWAREKGLEAAHTVIEKGDPKDLLVEEAILDQADLLVMGLHSGRELVHLFLGSVAKAAAYKAPCDVLLCPPKRRTGKSRAS